MDNRDEVRAFLSSRRAKITPEQAGVVLYGRNRRVPGLRRSEVADLAGVSVEYYAQLERGNLAGSPRASWTRSAGPCSSARPSGSTCLTSPAPPHPIVGDLHLSYDVMELSADPGLALVAFSAEAGSPADDALRLLASWAATHEPADALATPGQT